jgi:hypothetical protein
MVAFVCSIVYLPCWVTRMGDSIGVTPEAAPRGADTRREVSHYDHSLFFDVAVRSNVPNFLPALLATVVLSS